jgi:hypothetical protein
MLRAFVILGAQLELGAQGKITPVPPLGGPGYNKIIRAISPLTMLL